MGSVRWPPNSSPKLQSSSSSHIWRFDGQFSYSPNKWTKTFLAALFSLMLVLPLLSCRLFVCDCPCLGQPETLLSFPQPSECNQVAATVPPLWACVPSASITPPPFRERTHFMEASMHAMHCIHSRLEPDNVAYYLSVYEDRNLGWTKASNLIQLSADSWREGLCWRVHGSMH